MSGEAAVAAPAAATPANASQADPAASQAGTKPAAVATTQVAPAQQGEAAKPQIDPKIAAAFAEMQKREKKFTEDRRRFDGERKALAKQAEELKVLQGRISKAKENPEEALRALNMTYDQLVEWKLQQENPTPESRTKAEINEAKALAQKNAEELASFKQATADKEAAATKAAEQAAQRQVNEARGRFYQSAIAFVQQNVADYALTDLNQAHAEVPALIEKVFKKTAQFDEQGNLVKPGRSLSVKEAADMIEQHFVELAEKVTSSEKWKKLQAAKAQPPAPKEDEKPGAPAQRSTVDNSLTAATKPAGAKAPAKRETEDEMLKRAVAKFNEVKNGAAKK